MKNKLNLEQFEGHTEGPWEFDGRGNLMAGDIILCSMDPEHLTEADCRAIEAAPDLPTYAKQRDAELKESRKEVEELRERNKEGIDELNGIIASGYYGQMMTRLAYVRRKLEGKQ